MTTAANRTAETVLPVLLDPDRSRAIADTGLASGADPTMDRLARLASALMDAPRAFVSLVTADRQLLPGMVRHDTSAGAERDQPLSASLCQFAVATEEPLIVPDSSQDALVRDMQPVRDGQIGAYAGFPLRTRGGHVLGTLCVADGRARPWESSRLSLLEDLTALAAQEVEQRLALSRERRLQELVARMAERVPPLGDAVHSLTGLAEDQDDPRLQRYAALTRSRFESVDSLAQQLREAADERLALPSRGHTTLDLGRLCENAVRSARAATGVRALGFRPGDGPLPVRCDGLGLERAIVHVLVTALHHSRDDCGVELRLERPDPTGSAGDDVSEVVLTVEARDSRVATGELARIVSRFAAVGCSADAGAASGPATIRVTGSGVTAESGWVRGRAARDGRFVLTGRWPLGNVAAEGAGAG